VGLRGSTRSAASLPSRAGRKLAFVAALPALAGAVVAAFGGSGAEGRFHAGLAALAAAAAVFAFAQLTLRQAVAALGFAATAVGGLAWAGGAAPAGALAALVLTLGVGMAAVGLAALGRVIGAGPVGAGAVALALLTVGLTGLFWADPLAERLPRSARWGVKQAVLHLDAGTALAYDAAGFDRLLDLPVYTSVPLASSSIEKPRAPVTAALWGALGLVALSSAGLVRTLQRHSGARP